MARVTVEDCVEKVDDRFELVAVAAQRAKNIASGSPLKIERDGEKNTVIALREIAGYHVEVDDLRENIVREHQKLRNMDEDVERELGVESSEEPAGEYAGENISESGLALETVESEGQEAAFEEEIEVEAAIETAVEDALKSGVSEGDMDFSDENVDVVD